MNFKGHICGGFVGVIISVVLLLCFKVNEVINQPLNLLIVAGLIIFFSLYPDFDTASVPQRWFFRCLFVLFCILFYEKKYEYISLISIVSIVPLLHKHRGLTHMILFSCFFPFAIAYMVEYYMTENILDLNEMLQKYGIYIASAIIGWWTHLFLDKISFRS